MGEEVELEKILESDPIGSWEEHKNTDICRPTLLITRVGFWRSKYPIDHLKRIAEREGYSAIRIYQFGSVEQAELIKFYYQLISDDDDDDAKHRVDHYDAKYYRSADRWSVYIYTPPKETQSNQVSLNISNNANHQFDVKVLHKYYMRFESDY